MNILGIIPARYASTRFPGKPLVMIHGKSMIRRVFEQASACKSLASVIVATDDERIQAHVLGFGGRVAMTSPDHRSGTDRCMEVLAQQLKDDNVPQWDAVVNIQGDEPYIDPAQIGQVADCFLGREVQIATLATKISSEEDVLSSDVVKVVIDDNGNALYFSRFAIPFYRNLPEREWLRHHEYYKHIGIYGYRSPVLRQISGLAPSSLEKAESLEQLRWLQNGFRIHVGITDFNSISIDTPEDLDRLASYDNH